MKKFSIVTLIWALLLINSILRPAHAIGLDEVMLLDLSTSKKSFIIDRGQFDNYNDGTFGKFYVQRGEMDAPKIFLVAEGKLVKSLTNKSFWYIDKVYYPQLIKSGKHLLVLTSSVVTKERPMRFKKRHVVVSKDQYENADEYLDQNKNSVPERLVVEEENYEKSPELFETKKTPEADVEINTYEKLRKKSGTKISEEYGDTEEEKYFVGAQEVKLADLKNAEDKKLLDSMSDGYIKKVNSQKYGLTNGLYGKNKKDPGMRELNQEISILSVYDTAKEERTKAEQLDPKLIAKMKRDGAHWSEDMDDEALRRYFIHTGLEREERRRELVLNELDGNEVMFHYSGSMVDHTTSTDQNYRSPGYTLGLGYDLHLSRTSKSLKNWSIQFLLEKGVSDYDIGGKNARGQEGFYGAYLNYYFFNNPLTLNSFIFLGGVGIKAGTISMSALSLSKTYTYQTITLPSMQLMTKYRFRTGDLNEDTVNVGASINAGILIDSKRLSIVESNSDNIDGKISSNDVKYLIGMSIYF